MGGKYYYGVDRAKKDLRMRHVSDMGEKLEKEIERRTVFLFLDYDGTLTPIVDMPEQAILPKKTKEIFKALSENNQCRVAIISGRALRDIKKLVGLKGIIYVGNHGLEIDAPGIVLPSFIFPRIKVIMRNIKNDLKKRLLGMKGIFLEDKGITLSIHYRLATKASFIKMQSVFKETVRPYLARGKIKINKGKKVFEIRPSTQWNKGYAVLCLLERLAASHGEKDALPIYIGDDATDEDAFKVLRKRGITIFVGRPRNSAADYFLNDTKEVADFLKRIAKLKQYDTVRKL